MLRGKIFVQLFAWKEHWDYAMDEEYVAKFHGEIPKNEHNIVHFESLEDAKKYVESLSGMEVLEDNSVKSDKFGECIDITYTIRGIFHGLHYANIWNLNKVDKYFLE